MQQFKVRYTPYGLSDDVRGFCEAHLANVPHCAHKEDKGRGDQSSIHYHIWVETLETKKTLTNHLQSYFHIPMGTRGAQNAHYSVMPIVTKGNYNATYNLGYIQKDGVLTATNMSPNRLLEALEYYKAHRPAEEVTSLPREEFDVETLTKSNRSIEDQYLEYLTYMKKQVQGNLIKITSLTGATRYREPINMQWVSKKSKAYWAGKGIGLFPIGSTDKRFKASFYYEYLTKIEGHNETTEEEFVTIGY